MPFYYVTVLELFDFICIQEMLKLLLLNLFISVGLIGVFPIISKKIISLFTGKNNSKLWLIFIRIGSIFYWSVVEISSKMGILYKSP